MAEWIKHVSHVLSLLPAEILILLGIIFAIEFKVICMIYRAQKKETARTRLALEIGNDTDSIVLLAMELPYLAKHYRMRLNRADLAFHLVESKFGAKLSWTNGVYLTNTVLEINVALPPKITVPFWKVAKLRSLLQIPHYVTIQILSDATNNQMDVIVLQKSQVHMPPTMRPTAPLYPGLPSLASPGATLTPLEQKY